MNLGQLWGYVGQLTGQYADSLMLAGAVISVSLLVAASYRRARRRRSVQVDGQPVSKPKVPTSKRLLPLSIACTTGMSAQGMWTVATNALHQTGIVRIALFAFAELALLTAASAAGEALARLRELLKDPPAGDASDADKALHAADVAAATRKAKLFTALVWTIAVGAGLAAQSIGTDLTERGVRMFPALLVAAFWYAQLDRSGLAVSSETITSRISYKRMKVFLRLADPGTIGLGDVDRKRRLDRLVKALHRYHRVKARKNPWSATVSWADYRVDRAQQAANRYMDGRGLAYIQGQLTVRYNLRDATTVVALQSADPWRAVLDSGQVIGQFLPDTTDRSAVSLTAGQSAGQSTDSTALTGQAPVSGQRTALTGQRSVVSPTLGQLTGQDAMELTGGQRSADSADRTADSGQRTADMAVVGEVIERGQTDRSSVSRSVSGQRSAVSPEAMAHFLSAWLDSEIEAGNLAAGRIPGRPTVIPVLRAQFGSCSTEIVSKLVLPLLRELRTAQDGR